MSTVGTSTRVIPTPVFLSLRLGHLARAVVGDRRGHQQHVGALERGPDGGLHLDGRLHPGDRHPGRGRRRRRGGDQLHLGARLAAGGGERVAHLAAGAVAEEPHRIDGLTGAPGGDHHPRPRAARDGIRVRSSGPGLATHRRRRVARQPRGEVASRGRLESPAAARHDLDDLGGLRHPADPLVAAGQPPGDRTDEGHAPPAQGLDVLPGSRGAPTSPSPSPARSRAAPGRRGRWRSPHRRRGRGRAGR